MSNVFHLIEGGLDSFPQRLKELQIEREKFEAKCCEQKKLIVEQYQSFYSEYKKMCNKMHQIWLDIRDKNLASDPKMIDFIQELFLEDGTLTRNTAFIMNKCYDEQKTPKRKI